MKTVSTVEELRSHVALARAKGMRVGLVPTMGYFHDGHLALIEAARRSSDLVIVSIFINPKQFGPWQDLDSYPRDLERDSELASNCGADILFCPSEREVYGIGFKTKVAVAGLTESLCGSPERRGPEHFHAVTTVVAKLFNIAQPDFAFFGRKDAQQARVISQMAEDLNFPVEIELVDTVREPDGLAMSSRNSYLNEAERLQARALYSSLKLAEGLITDGQTDPAIVIGEARHHLSEAGVEPEYFEIVSATSLHPLKRLEGELLIAVAAKVGRARLIDNVTVEVPVKEVSQIAA